MSEDDQQAIFGKDITEEEVKDEFNKMKINDGNDGLTKGTL